MSLKVSFSISLLCVGIFKMQLLFLCPVCLAILCVQSVRLYFSIEMCMLIRELCKAFWLLVVLLIVLSLMTCWNEEIIQAQNGLCL